MKNHFIRKAFLFLSLLLVLAFIFYPQIDFTLSVPHAATHDQGRNLVKKIYAGRKFAPTEEVFSRALKNTIYIGVYGVTTEIDQKLIEQIVRKNIDFGEDQHLKKVILTYYPQRRYIEKHDPQSRWTEGTLIVEPNLKTVLIEK